MSPQPIVHSGDLSRLRAEGFALRVAGGKLVVDDIPFVDAAGVVRLDGSLVMTLTLAGDITDVPSEHTAHFVGGVPCGPTGAPLDHIINNVVATDLGDGLVAACYLSAKPTTDGRYTDFHHKVITYVGHISGPAQVVDPTATARRFRPVQPDDGDDTPFRYLDTASSRAGIAAINDRVRGERVGIIGLGGGSYVLDFAAKTPVAGIHLFDPDRLLTHNGFRAPGAVTLDALNGRPFKVDYFAEMYNNMRAGIVAHPYRIDEANADELKDLTFVFIAIDDAPAKAPIIAALLAYGIPFIDLGLGVEAIDGTITGIVRSTLVTEAKHDHVADRISTTDAAAGEDYRSNIQIAELNALNAAMAVMQWKKHRGIYAAASHPHHTMYSIASNRIVNDEVPVVDSDSAARSVA